MRSVEPRSRIGGIAGAHDPSARERFLRVLGPRARLLGSEPQAIVADADTASLTELRDLASAAGPFAMAWREADGAVCLARDPIGERTLFYAARSGCFTFASSLRAVLAAGGASPELDIAAVAAYLSYGYVPGPATLVRDIREVLPGEIVRWHEGRTTSRFFWTLPAEPPEGEPDESALRARLRRELERAVERRLPTGEPVGAFLSGGLDSSLVVALASRRHDRPLHTFSVAFGVQHPNELAWSSLVAAHCGTRHRVVEVSAEAIDQHFDATIATLEHPIGDPLTVPNFVLFGAASEEVGVVLNGEGGDPCFGGPKNLPMLLAELFGDGFEERDDPRRRERTYLRAHQKCYGELADILEPEALASAGDALEAQLEPWFNDPRWHNFVTKLMALNVRFKGGHHILPKVDALAAPFGVLARSPLFDRAVVETAFAIPPQLKLRGSVEKYILKRAVDDVLPEAILQRPKSGMLVPVESWFKGPLADVARRRLVHSLPDLGPFRESFMSQLVYGKLAGVRPRRGVKIWLLLTLESWLRSLRA